MLSVKVKQGSIGVNINCIKTGVLLQATDLEEGQTRIVLSKAEALLVAKKLVEYAQQIEEKKGDEEK